MDKLLKSKFSLVSGKKSDALTINPQYVRKQAFDTHFNYFVDKDKEIVKPFLDVLTLVSGKKSQKFFENIEV